MPNNQEHPVTTPMKLLTAPFYISVLLGLGTALDHRPMASVAFFCFAGTHATARGMQRDITEVKKGEIGSVAAGYFLSMFCFLADLTKDHAHLMEIAVGTTATYFGYQMLRDKPSQPKSMYHSKDNNSPNFD
jgi:hypothetical protein